MKITFTVYGPPKPQARHRSTKQGHMYDPSSEVKRTFMQALQEERPNNPMEGPLMILLKFYFARPKSHYNKKGLKPNAPVYYVSKGRNDFDNLAKMVCDAMNGIMYGDDGQIAKAGVMKLYDEVPRTEVTLQEI